ncbi:MAG: septum formation protein Maf [Chloroflexi bacterium]|nr:septum formation protein Maf [Chloroflexota bacterium]
MTSGGVPLFLASRSPRRQYLLGLLGVPFHVVVSHQDEAAITPGEDLGQKVEKAAWAKVASVLEEVREGVVVAADTVVFHQGRVMGKPKDGEEAREMLLRLRGAEHLIITGVAMVRHPQGISFAEHVTTVVKMRPYSLEEIVSYIATGDPLDKAGAYAIQNPAFHPGAKVVGCFLNVVGLPLCAVLRGLAALGTAMDHPAVPSPHECSWCAGEAKISRCPG